MSARDGKRNKKLATSPNYIFQTHVHTCLILIILVLINYQLYTYTVHILRHLVQHSIILVNVSLVFMQDLSLQFDST